jgi:hypothetical protein
LRSRETGWIAIGYLVIFLLINGLNAILHKLDLDMSELQNLCKSSVKNLDDLKYSPFSAYFHKVDAPVFCRKPRMLTTTDRSSPSTTNSLQ